MSLSTEKTPAYQEPLASPVVLEHVLIRRGSACPRCREGSMDYNGMLDLECDRCGFSLVEAAGCS